MPIPTWLRLGKEAPRPGTPPTPPTSTRAAPPRPPPVELLPLQASELAAAWRPGERRLMVPAAAAATRGGRVTVQLLGVRELTLLVGGAVRDVRQAGRGWVVEVEPDEEQASLLGRLLAALKGEAELPRVRPPRYRASLPAVVSSASGVTFMKTFSVSEGGCGLAWSGPPPRLGGGLHVRVGTGPQAAAFRAMVCWVREGSKGLRVGVRFLAGQAPTWAALVGEARRGAAAS